MRKNSIFNPNKGDGENLRKELEMNKGRADQINHEHKIRLRSFQEDIQRMKDEFLQKNESLRSPRKGSYTNRYFFSWLFSFWPWNSEIDVIVSVDGNEQPRSKSMDRGISRKSMKLAGADYRREIKTLESSILKTDGRLDKFEELVIQRLDEVASSS